jgi:hypothetical protein
MPTMTTRRFVTVALAMTLAATTSLMTGCSSADTAPEFTASPATLTKSLSGRYEPVTDAGDPTAALYGISSLWFNGRGDYQMVLSDCASDCEETGTYSIDANNVLSLQSFTHVTRTFHLDSIDIQGDAQGIKLQNTGSGSGTGSGTGSSSGSSSGSGSGSGASGSNDGSGDNSCATSDTESSDDESNNGGQCGTPKSAAKKVGMSQKSGPSAGSGKSSPGASGMQRTGGSMPTPGGSHKQTVTLLYLGSPAFLAKCAGGKYGCGASVNAYPKEDLYFSAPKGTAACGQHAQFCKGSNCVTAVRVESSDSHQHFEGSYGLIKALGDTPVDGSCSGGGSGSISGVTVSW